MKYGINRLIVLIIAAFYIYAVKLSGLIFKGYICRESVGVNRAVVHISVRIHNRNIRALIRPDIANSVLSRLKNKVFGTVSHVGFAYFYLLEILYSRDFEGNGCFGKCDILFGIRQAYFNGNI